MPIEKQAMSSLVRLNAESVSTVAINVEGGATMTQIRGTSKRVYKMRWDKVKSLTWVITV
jgi:hypothetical protein